MVYPILTALVTAVFAVQVWGDFARRRRPYQAAWFASLAMSAVASAAYAVAAGYGTPAAFRLYYLFGALLAGAYMGMGSLYLVLSRRLAHSIMIVLLVLSIVGVVMLWGAAIDQEALATLAGSSGRGVLVPGAWQGLVALLNVFGALAVVLVALYSARQAYLKQIRAQFMWGNLLIAAGILFVSMAGSAARWVPQWDGSFWVAMAFGWFLAFAGFRVISAGAEAQRAQQGS